MRMFDKKIQVQGFIGILHEQNIRNYYFYIILVFKIDNCNLDDFFDFEYIFYLASRILIYVLYKIYTNISKYMTFKRIFY